jgi:hypothetical protein
MDKRPLTLDAFIAVKDTNKLIELKTSLKKSYFKNSFMDRGRCS